MKKKVLFIAAVMFSSVFFTACDEEIIQPNTEIDQKEGNGAKEEDPGQWD